MSLIEKLITNSNLPPEDKAELVNFVKTLNPELIKDLDILLKNKGLSLEKIIYYFQKKKKIIKQQDKTTWYKLIQEEKKDLESL